MATENYVHVSDDLLAALKAKASAEGRTIDQVAEDALRQGLEEKSWQEMFAYGRKTGIASGFKEADVPDIIHRRRLQGR